MSQQSEEIILDNGPHKSDVNIYEISCRILKSCLLKAVSVGAIYFTGYCNIHPFFLVGYFLWLIIRNQQRLDKRFQQQVAMAISLRSDRQMVLANMEQPPPWIYFHDMEFCEWLNKIICHIWPSLGGFIEEVLNSEVEPIINKELSEYKKNMNFKFENVMLGTITPRVCGIKVNSKNSRYYQEIIIDTNICYMGDAELSFSIMSINGGISNFEISGWMRIVLKMCFASKQPLGAVEVFFLEQPKVDYELSGIMDVLGIPGINGIVRRTIDDQINQNLVLPSKIIHKFDDVAETGQWKCPDPEGFLRVNVVEAKDLPGYATVGWFTSPPDTHVEVTFGSKTLKSQVKVDTINPEWNFWADFIVDNSFDETILIVIKDKANPLGKVSFELSLVKEKGKLDSWIELVDVEKGVIHLCVYYYQISSNPLDLSVTTEPYLLVVFLNSVKNINSGSKNKISAIAHLTVGEASKYSKSVSAEDPKFEEVFSFLVKNPDSEKLEVKLNDKNTDKVLGSLDLTLENLLKEENMEIFDMKHPLSKAGGEPELSLTLKLRTLTSI